MKLIIIDSGLDKSHKLFTTPKIDGFSIINNMKFNNYDDIIGHGTGVASIIVKAIPDIELLCIKIFHDDEDTKEENLICALRYIENNESPAILHISSGVIQSNFYDDMKKLCDSLYDKGFIIVSSFDNYGAISYPAAFDSVIGVMADIRCKKDSDIIRIEDSVVDFMAKGIAQTVLWSNNTQMYVSGSSFASPYITIQIIELIRQGYYNIGDIIDKLRESAINVIELKKSNYNKLNENLYNTNKIKNAVVFPFNKEIHSLVRMNDMLSFSLQDIYNFKYLGNIGKTTKDLIKNYQDKKNYIIKNIDKINWESEFDTFILGHCNDIVEVIKYDIYSKIIDMCYKYNKNIFMFDSKYLLDDCIDKFNNKDLWVWVPGINNEIPYRLLNKLNIINTPILCVCGTSSKQGKFNLQLHLRKEFQAIGYEVAQLGTEPTSELFNFNATFPIGYNAETSISNNDAVITVNNTIKILEKNNPDIIIVGSQSNVIPYQIRNLGDIAYHSYEFMLGTNPDIIVLCVNIEDEIGYIERSIKYLEGLTDSKVIALVLFPMKKRFTWSGIYIDNDIYSDDELDFTINKLEKTLGLSVYINGNEAHIIELTNKCIQYLTQ